MNKLACLFSSSLLLAAASLAAAEPKHVKFVERRIDNYRCESVCVADFNGDGKLDILSGEFLYLAPDFKPARIRGPKGKVGEDGKGYLDYFMDLPLDVDGDGKLDVVSAGWFSKSMTWYRNVGTTGELWPETVIDKHGNYECGELLDVTGEGKQVHIFPAVRETLWYELAKGDGGKPNFLKHMVSKRSIEWGVGVGDINGDGRPDIIRPSAWYEAPADPRTGEWKEHPLSLGGRKGRMEHTPQILVYDVNGDGLPDIITSSAHGYGIFWYEQVRDGDTIRWKQHTIDDTWTQAHSLALADINGDGVMDLVTGKRFMAHNGADPEETAPLGVYWYELQRKPTVTWTKHVISYDKGIGSGVQIVVTDINGDGVPDVIVNGKFGGPVIFEGR